MGAIIRRIVRRRLKLSLGVVLAKFLVTIERDEDGVYVVECPAIPGCVSQGNTEEDALGNVKDAILQCLEVRAERRIH